MYYYVIVITAWREIIAPAPHIRKRHDAKENLLFPTLKGRFHNFWAGIATAVVLVIAAVVLAVNAIPGGGAQSAPHHHPQIGAHPYNYVTTVPASATQPPSVQLATRGYSLVDFSTNYSTSTGRTIHSETWQYQGMPGGLPDTVYLNDFASPNQYTVVRVTFDPAPGFTDFWCVPPADDASSVSATLMSMSAEYSEALLLQVKPDPHATSPADTATVETAHCYMR